MRAPIYKMIQLIGFRCVHAESVRPFVRPSRFCSENAKSWLGDGDVMGREKDKGGGLEGAAKGVMAHH